ncbi:hypothetical protein DMH02_017215 [Streptomyces sp. WAC 00631]|uniref:hypothetical protein n=1 Tax=unclassified Streptomyces TaxID=2593676 RepID=UPI000F7B1CEF|nr:MULTISPECIES: hypothetical protein [unclassified Streptomyces]MCC5034908.1 hypothetical protein [Streptomyces sp. WAC 00631]MCC9741741.1 hypothetical protein [Streptomyces sp. MNU89]
MRRTRALRALAGAVLTGAALLATAGTATADDPSASPGTGGEDGAPTAAGTTFRLATAIRQGERAAAEGSAGDYFYWVFPADAGQRVTVTATVKLPESADRQGASRWRIDVHDGLRRRQACVHGSQTRSVPADAASVQLACTLRTVRAWAEPWGDAPLPGSYYIRLTVVDLPQRDLGLPVRAEIEATSVEAGGAHAVDGRLSTPLVPLTVTGPEREDRDSAQEEQEEQEEQEQEETAQAAGAPEGGWSSGWWTDRWIWTAAGGLVAAFTTAAGYSLARGPGRRPSTPPRA